MTSAGPRVESPAAAAPVAGGPPRRGRASWLGRAVAAVLLPLALLVVWQAVVWATGPEEWLLPSPLQVAETLWGDRGRLWFHAQATIATTLAGLAVAVAAGASLALLIAASRTAERALYPWVVASQTVPVLAIAPLLVVWLDPEPSMILLAALVAFFPIVVGGVDGLRGADPLMARTLRTMGAEPRWVWRHVLIPAALPSFFTGLRMAAVFAVTGAVVGEYVGSDRGLGAFSKLTTGQFQTRLAFAAIAWLAVIGVALFAAVAGVERLALPYRRRPARRRRHAPPRRTT